MSRERATQSTNGSLANQKPNIYVYGGASERAAVFSCESEIEIAVKKTVWSGAVGQTKYSLKIIISHAFHIEIQFRDSSIPNEHDTSIWCVSQTSMKSGKETTETPADHRRFRINLITKTFFSLSLSACLAGCIPSAVFLLRSFRFVRGENLWRKNCF